MHEINLNTVYRWKSNQRIAATQAQSSSDLINNQLESDGNSLNQVEVLHEIQLWTLRFSFPFLSFP